MVSDYWLHFFQVTKGSLSMLIYAEMRGMYDANMAPCIVYVPTKFGKDSFIIKEIIAKNVISV